MLRLGLMELVLFSSKRSGTLDAVTCGSMVFMANNCGKVNAGDERFPCC